MKSNADRTKQLRIKTGVLKRIAKEKELYEDEVVTNENLLQDMYEEVQTESVIRKQQELVDTSKAKVADGVRKLKKSYRDLEETVELENMVTAEKSILETKEYREAIELLSEVKNKLEED